MVLKSSTVVLKTEIDENIGRIFLTLSFWAFIEKRCESEHFVFFSYLDSFTFGKLYFIEMLKIYKQQTMMTI